MTYPNKFLKKWVDQNKVKERKKKKIKSVTVLDIIKIKLYQPSSYFAPFRTRGHPKALVSIKGIQRQGTNKRREQITKN